MVTTVHGIESKVFNEGIDSDDNFHSDDKTAEQQDNHDENLSGKYAILIGASTLKLSECDREKGYLLSRSIPGIILPDEGLEFQIAIASNFTGKVFDGPFNFIASSPFDMK